MSKADHVVGKLVLAAAECVCEGFRGAKGLLLQAEGAEAGGVEAHLVELFVEGDAIESKLHGTPALPFIEYAFPVEATQVYARVWGCKGPLHVEAFGGVMEAQLIQAVGLRFNRCFEVVHCLVLHYMAVGCGCEDHVGDPVHSRAQHSSGCISKRACSGIPLRSQFGGLISKFVACDSDVGPDFGKGQVDSVVAGDGGHQVGDALEEGTVFIVTQSFGLVDGHLELVQGSE